MNFRNKPYFFFISSCNFHGTPLLFSLPPTLPLSLLSFFLPSCSPSFFFSPTLNINTLNHTKSIEISHWEHEQRFLLCPQSWFGHGKAFYLISLCGGTWNGFCHSFPPFPELKSVPDQYFARQLLQTWKFRCFGCKFINENNCLFPFKSITPLSF